MQTYSRGMTTISQKSINGVDLLVSDRGSGPAYLVLHGGAGPASVAHFSDLLAATGARVVTPTHPGFGGTQRPDDLTSIAGLAALYAALLDDLDVSDVTVVGNSIGGWVAAELALLHPVRVGGLVLVDAVGIDVPEHPVVDFFSLTMQEVAARSWYDPTAFRPDPALLTPEGQVVLAGNRASLATYGATMTDPGLLVRLAEIDLPTMVLWGESDRIVTPDYGRVFAAAIPSAEFRLLHKAGHVPQLETPTQLVDAVREFSGRLAQTPRTPQRR